VRKQGGQTEIELDGLSVRAASVLAQRVPTVVINSQVADILTENPSNRRALIDRTMFHVEPSYVVAWKNYRVALRQRNELLRRQARQAEATFWDTQLIKYAEQIDEKRLTVLKAINLALEDHPLAANLGNLHFEYTPGWKRELPLADQLRESWGKDLRISHTSVGMHRADLALRCESRAVARRISRGQGKVIVCCVLLALADFIAKHSGFKPVILVDDLAAELDDRLRAAVVERINRTGGQRVFTAIKPGELPEISESTQVMFHVEHTASVT